MKGNTRPYYFGVTLAYNQAYLKFDYDDSFLKDGTFVNIQPLHTSGFSLGLLGNLKMVNHLDLRLNPLLNFSEKDLEYVFAEGAAEKSEKKKLESVVMTIPLQLRLKSERIGNFRAYVLGGVKLDKDFAANSTDRKADDIIKIKADDFGYEGGFGFEFILPYFIFSPEIKISYGARDVHLREPTNQYSTPIGRLISRMIVFSIHFEG